MHVPKVRAMLNLAVTAEMTAKSFGSGTLPVVGTPQIVIMTERLCSEFCERFMDEGYTTVGGEISINHNAPTMLGGEICVTCTLVENDDRKLVFSIHAFDGTGEVATGRHVRYIVNEERFMTKALMRIPKDGPLLDFDSFSKLK